MKCLFCPGGRTTPGMKTAALERGATLLVVRHVPGEVCDTCGTALYTADTTVRLHDLLEEAVRAGAEVLVREFGAVETGTRETTHAGAARSE